MTTDIAHADSDGEIAQTFEVMQQLWPELGPDGYVAMIRSLMASDRMRLLALREGGVVRAVASYCVVSMIFTGSVIHVDDLITDNRVRSRGYGAKLIARLEEVGKELECTEIQLVSRTDREQAHRFYFREGFGIQYFHFRKKLSYRSGP